MQNKTKSESLQRFLNSIELTEDASTLYFDDKEVLVKEVYADFTKLANSVKVSNSGAKTIFLDRIKFLKRERKSLENKAEVLSKNPLNNLDKQLWNDIYFAFPNSVGAPMIFKKVNAKTNTFIRTVLDNTTIARMVDEEGYNDKAKQLFANILVDPKRYRLNPPKGFDINTKCKSKWKNGYPETLSDYWIKSEKFIYDSCHNKLNDVPKAFTNDTNVPNLGFFDLHNIGDNTGETPNWDNWMTQFNKDDIECIKAFFFGIIDGKNTARQCLYLHTAGYQGKTFAINALGEFLGKNLYGTLDSEKLKTQFWAASIYDKRLISWDDIQNSSVLRYEKVKRLLGKGLVSVEYKGKDSFDAFVEAKLIMASNYAPDLNSKEVAETSRILYIKGSKFPRETLLKICELDEYGEPKFDVMGRPIYKSKEDFTKVLVRELPDFLAKCKISYDNLCSGNGMITPTNNMKTNIETLCENEEQFEWEQFIDKYFERSDDPEAYVVVSKLNELYKREFSTNTVPRRFTNYLNDSIGDVSIRRTPNGRQKSRAGIILKGTKIQSVHDDIDGEVL